MKKGLVFSSAKVTFLLIKEMFKDIFSIDFAEDFETFSSLLLNEEYDFIIIDRTLKKITSKEVFEKLLNNNVENIPPSILLTQKKYEPEHDGEGYSFILRKPFLKNELIEAVNFVISKENEKKINTILIVDDSSTTRKVIKKKLLSLGYSCIDTDTPLKALDIVRKEYPDLIIVDYILPDMNGVELARNLSKMNNMLDVPIVLLTGFADLEKIKEEGFDAGISEYFQKPLKEEELLSFFDKYINRKSNANILIIDDSSTRRKVLYSNLKVNNNNVITSENINKAKALLQDNNFDIILCDLVLKNESAFDGIRIFREINELIPIIVYSAIADRKNIYKVLEAGANDYLWAPIEMKELLLKTQIWMDFYRIVRENAMLKSKPLSSNVPTSFIEEIDEKFNYCRMFNKPASLVYLKSSESYDMEKIKNFLRGDDITGLHNGKLFIFIYNQDYISTIKICRRIKKILSENLSFGIASINSVNTVEELFENAEKNIITI